MAMLISLAIHLKISTFLKNAHKCDNIVILIVIQNNNKLVTFKRRVLRQSETEMNN